jgi:transcription elongation GreA/GreB family factor
MTEKIIALLKNQLSLELDQLKVLALNTRKESTDPELVQKSKYETQGIEASYLADAHARRLEELHQEKTRFEIFESKKRIEKNVILVGSYVTLEGAGGFEYYFISPVSSRGSVSVEGKVVKIVSEASPFGRELIGLYVGDGFEIEVLGKNQEFSVKEIQ